MRLFVSVPLYDLADEVEAVQDRFRDASGLTFTDPGQAHVTLKFLGDVDEGRVETVEEAVERGVAEADVSPFTARVEGLGVFPNLDYISVVWLGFSEGGEELTRLHEGVEAEVTDLGFDPEDHEFTPHSTVARMNHAGGKDRVVELVEEWTPAVGETTIDEVHVVESERTPEGAVHTPVHRVSLG